MFSGLNKKEARKLAAIEILKRDDAERDRALGEFARLASRVMGVSGCFVTIFDDRFQYIKFSFNIPDLSGKMPVEETLCKHSVAACQPVICSDTRTDPRFVGHPLVRNGHVIFYAAAPLKTKDGDALGTLCVSEQSPFTPTQSDIEEFLRIASLASAYLESWYSLGRIDPLTGLPNRQHLRGEIERLTHKSKTQQHALLIFDCIDIPRAYELSRYLGLAAIEKMLHSFGPLLRMRLELDKSVTLYAFATGRYAVLVTSQYARILIRRAKNLPSTRALITGDIEVQLNIFTGYVFFKGRTIPPAEILRRSVSALHEAIRQVVPVKEFDVTLDRKRNDDFRLLYDLSQAFKSSDQIYLVYQPKVSLRTEKIVGVEALLRWKHPERGQISPAVIVGLAQKTSLMNDITHWVVNEALRQIGLWHAADIHIPVSVNFTVSDVSQPGFANALESKLLKLGLTTADIRIECLETEEIIANETALRELDILKNKGFDILLDDFGAGYSNINYLRKIPLDVIKLDRSIIGKIAEDTGSRIIAKNIITMLKELDYTVLAEGVENAETAAILREFGCDEAQGFYYCHPMMAKDLIDWLTSRTATTDTDPDNA
ncbi:EAL domain-containing protein [Yokenella regensburgei]|uniref:sensor domain-containing protein n=1 Tax=Yokenella regensburgei TaxID=158877 RepID=UPI003F14C633